jgi:hypothetical protein
MMQHAKLGRHCPYGIKIPSLFWICGCERHLSALRCGAQLKKKKKKNCPFTALEHAETKT